jgi:hypothetical protein
VAPGISRLLEKLLQRVQPRVNVLQVLRHHHLLPQSKTTSHTRFGAEASSSSGGM